uniref:Reverse transcriptase RNase H-like domain-containing protein n=1 Tax=Moniliophthora roreri TaxID=221103 RepID=A0A0W0F704_MONRR
MLPNGQSVTKIHPIAYASKRTSRSEKKYQPFLLEFAALKFALDKFSDTIWGFPVEIETDCQALRDVLLNDKLNAAHARWRDGILAHQIVDVRHVPGKLNVVADGLSRTWDGQSDTKEGDGSEWTVSEDWESEKGLVNDLFQVAMESTPYTMLKERFKKEPMFLEVIAALEGLQVDGTVKEKKRA